MHMRMERTFTGGGLTGFGLYMVVMLEHLALWNRRFGGMLLFWVGGAHTYYTAHGSSYADDNKSALHTQVVRV